MARTLLTTALFLAFSSMGAPQIKAPTDVGINEKLGKQVALDVVLKDENANDLTLARLVDKPTVLMFNYYRCPGICPVLLNSMVDVVNRIQLEPGKDFRLIAVSFDPADTPEQALEAVKQALIGAQTDFAAALAPLGKSDIRQLADRLYPVLPPRGRHD